MAHVKWCYFSFYLILVTFQHFRNCNINAHIKWHEFLTSALWIINCFLRFDILTFSASLCFVLWNTNLEYDVMVFFWCTPPGLNTVNQQRMKSRKLPRRCRCPLPHWPVHHIQNLIYHLDKGYKTGSTLQSLFQASHTMDAVSKLFLLMSSQKANFTCILHLHLTK